jgi:hypothetical protein
MTDEQKLNFLLKILKDYAEMEHCYNKYGDDYNPNSYTHGECAFDDGSEYGEITFARTLLEQMGVEFKNPTMKEDNWDLKDDSMDEMVAELKGQTLYGVICDWWDEIFTNDNPSGQNIGSLVDTIEKWLPKEQSANSQNAYVECTVEGFNDCLNKIRGKLR